MPFNLKMFSSKPTKQTSSSQEAQRQANTPCDSYSTYSYDPKKDAETPTRPTDAEIKAIKKGRRPYSLTVSDDGLSNTD